MRGGTLYASLLNDPFLKIIYTTRICDFYAGSSR